MKNGSISSMGSWFPFGAWGERGSSSAADNQTHQQDHEQRKADEQTDHPPRACSRPKVERPARPRNRLRDPYAGIFFAEVQPRRPIAGVRPLSVVQIALIHSAGTPSNDGDQRPATFGEPSRLSSSRFRCIALLCAFALRHRLQLKNTCKRRSVCDPACLQGESYGIQFVGVGHAQVGRPPSLVINQINFHFSCKAAFMDQLDLLFCGHGRTLFVNVGSQRAGSGL